MLMFIFPAKRNLEEETFTGDTFYNDMVQKQYEKLPYPPVTTELLREEERFYSIHQETKPISSCSNFEQHVFHKLNYSLYGGNDDFRYKGFC